MQVKVVQEISTRSSFLIPAPQKVIQISVIDVYIGYEAHWNKVQLIVPSDSCKHDTAWKGVEWLKIVPTDRQLFPKYTTSIMSRSGAMKLSELYQCRMKHHKTMLDLLWIACSCCLCTELQFSKTYSTRFRDFFWEEYMDIQAPESIPQESTHSGGNNTTFTSCAGEPTASGTYCRKQEKF